MNSLQENYADHVLKSKLQRGNRRSFDLFYLPGYLVKSGSFFKHWMQPINASRILSTRNNRNHSQTTRQNRGRF